jgi:hypothetical protein
MHPTFVEASKPLRPSYIVRSLGVGMAILAIALIIWGHWLWGATILVAIPLIVWDDRQMKRQAEREASDPQNRPFPDFEKWRKWDSNI